MLGTRDILKRLEALKKTYPGLAAYFEAVGKTLDLLMRYPTPERDTGIASGVLEIFSSLKGKPQRVEIGRNTSRKSMFWAVFEECYLRPWAEGWRIKLWGSKDPLSPEEARAFCEKQGKGTELVGFYSGGRWEGHFVPEDSLLAQCAQEAEQAFGPFLSQDVLSFVLVGKKVDFPSASLYFLPLWWYPPGFLVNGKNGGEASGAAIFPYAVLVFFDPPTWTEMQRLYRILRQRGRTPFGPWPVTQGRYSEREVELFRFLVSRSLPPKRRGRMQFWEEAASEWNRTHREEDWFESPNAMREAWRRLKNRLIEDFGERIFESLANTEGKGGS